MIDLHCHMLPSLDDGATDLANSLEMARIAVADGISVAACTPHILPGVYDNTGPAIRAAVAVFSAALADAGIPLKIVTGADVHCVPDILAGLRSGRVLTLNDSRYLLFEPSHNVLPPRFEDFTFSLIAAGYVPVITHPERLKWIETHHDIIRRLVDAGAMTQLTGGSLTGRFGRRARYWAERLLDDGMVHVIATDAHSPSVRPPLLWEAREAAARRVGEEEAARLVLTRPAGILDDQLPSKMPPTTPKRKPNKPVYRGLFKAFG